MWEGRTQYPEAILMKTPEESDIEKRLLLAIVLSMAILFTVPYIYREFLPETPEVLPVAPPASGEEASERPSLPEEGPGVSEAIPSPAESTERTTPEQFTEAEERKLVVENDHLILTFSNVGAQLVSVRLKEYLNEDGMPLELVPQGNTEQLLGPLSLYSSDEMLRDALPEAIYDVRASGPSSQPSEVHFLYRDAELEVAKTVRVPESGYVLEVSASVTRLGRSLPFGVVLGTGIGPEGTATAGDFRDAGTAFRQAANVERYYLDDLEDGPVQVEGALKWAALDSKYFTMVLAGPERIRSVRMEQREWTLPPGPEGEVVSTVLVQGVVGLARDSSFKVFLGPKRTEILEGVEPSLSELINYGWFGILVRPLLVALKLIYGYVSNYGWAIIILTFLINLALFPVRYKQTVSMQKMSALQPQLKSIQDKYKRMKRDDPRKQQMNKEVMDLYKAHGVNPLGGCLPLLLQMPILFAFYRMLDASIELRGAPFIWWIQDLSKHDPYYVTPIVMGLTMVAQQKMMPAAGDPTQRRMMMFLPIMFTFFFLSVSSGLAIYFLFSNVFAMMLQFLLQRLKAEQVTKAPVRPQKKVKKKG